MLVRRKALHVGGCALLAPALMLAPAPASAAGALERKVAELFSAPDVAPWLRVRSVVIDELSADVGVEVPERFPLDALPAIVDLQFEAAVGIITAARPSVRQLDLLVAHPGQPLSPPPKSQAPPPAPRFTAKPDLARFPHGQALAGRTVALSPGHGYIWYDNLGRYSTQRSRIRWDGCGDCRGIVEDFETHEIVVRYLVPLLEGAGARVVVVRERDDNAAGHTTDTPEETAGTFTDGNSAGGHDGDYRASSDPSATAKWTLTASTTGPQLLSLWFVAGGNRHPDARLTVDTPAGQHTYLWDQSSHGRRWAPIERFDLDVGDRVVVHATAPAAADGTRYLIADAARLGSGTHDSGHRWWQMGASPFAQHQGAPREVASRGDVTIRPRSAEWYGADVYLSVHSNASGQPNSTAAGTSTYRFSCRRFPDHSTDPDPAQCDDPTGSDRLQRLVHDAVVGNLRRSWDPEWGDRGTRVANFGELRELDGIPGALIETAFHDNVRLRNGSALRMTDNQALHDPRVRQLVAYGLYEGLSEFLVGAGPLVLRPPEGLLAKRVDATTVEVDFNPVTDAAGYRIYVAAGRRTFDAGRIAPQPPVRLEGLPADTAIFVKVAALNAAGEGWPSRVVGARTGSERSRVLIIDGYQRLDAWVDIRDNAGTTVMDHGLALLDVGFDSASETASTTIELDQYDALLLALGRESSEHGVLTEALRRRITRFASNGGAVLASGSEIAWALGAQGDDQAFLTDVFGAGFGADDARATLVRSEGNGWLASGSSMYALAGTNDFALETKSSDVLTATAGAVVELRYGAGADVAAVRRGDNLLLGFAIDSVVPVAARAALLSAWTSRVLDAPMDAGIALDVGAPDKGVTGPDAGIVAPEDAMVADTQEGLRPRFYDRHPIRGGCSCTNHGGPEGHNRAGLAALFVLLALRRRFARRADRPSSRSRARRPASPPRRDRASPAGRCSPTA